MKKIRHLDLITNLLKAGFMFIILMNAAGCALYKAEFDCKYEKGLGCKSISEVNELVDQGQFKDKGKEASGAKNLEVASAQLPIIAFPQGSIQRIPEEHLRVWIAPHLDEQGNFHEASIIHTVIQPGRWQVVEEPQC